MARDSRSVMPITFSSQPSSASLQEVLPHVTLLVVFRAVRQTIRVSRRIWPARDAGHERIWMPPAWHLHGAFLPMHVTEAFACGADLRQICEMVKTIWPICFAPMIAMRLWIAHISAACQNPKWFKTLVLAAHASARRHDHSWLQLFPSRRSNRIKYLLARVSPEVVAIALRSSWCRLCRCGHRHRDRDNNHTGHQSRLCNRSANAT